ncbi:MAG TPA: phage holin family protein [Planctomycetaceae bacterium]
MIRDYETARGEPATEPVGGAEFRAEFRATERVAADRMPADRSDNRSITELLKDLRDETTMLVRQEIALAKTEMSEKAAKAGRNAGYMGAGSALAHAALIILLLGLSALLYHGLEAMGLDNMVAGWLAPLIVGGVAAAIGYALIQKAITAFKHESLVPEKTVDSLKENQQWLSRKATA